MVDFVSGVMSILSFSSLRTSLKTSRSEETVSQYLKAMLIHKVQKTENFERPSFEHLPYDVAGIHLPPPQKQRRENIQTRPTNPLRHSPVDTSKIESTALTPTHFAHINRNDIHQHGRVS
jgi:hypothetical protein